MYELSHWLRRYEAELIRADVDADVIQMQLGEIEGAASPMAFKAGFALGVACDDRGQGRPAPSGNRADTSAATQEIRAVSGGF